MDIKIIIATHKKYWMPEDEMYLPIHVGAEGKVSADGKPLDLGYTKDNTGENISAKNGSFCELTGLYWAWKNLECDYLGLAHYRRHFGKKKSGKDIFDSVLKTSELEPLTVKYKVLVPQKRKYYIESLYSHYAHTHDAKHLDITREILQEKYPEYVATFDEVMQRTWGYMFNMAIMQKPLFDNYCKWLFDILFELEKRVDTKGMSDFDKRYLGRVSERLFNVWLEQEVRSGNLQRNEIKELPYMHMEKVNWLKKGGAFLKAKFFGKKYEGSF